jgi:hypothetical protein
MADAAARTSETTRSVVGGFGIGEHGNARDSRPQFTQEPKLLRRKLHREGGDTGDVASRSAEAGDEASQYPAEASVSAAQLIERQLPVSRAVPPYLTAYSSQLSSKITSSP